MDALARVYLRYLRALGGFSRKCIVVDLDNTLWGGLVGEEGPRGVALGAEYPGNAYVAFQRALLALRDRGVLLAIASKNNAADAEQAFAENPAMAVKLSDFSAREIHWEPKSVSVARIAASLNIGLRHMVFVDDNPAECAEVERAHPSVTTIVLPRQPERFIDALLGEGLFDSLSFSAEDTRRAALYEQRDAAERLRTEAGSLEDYFKSLDMRVHLEPVAAHNVARAAQMTQKTTQFNSTTRRYTEADLNARAKSGAWAMLTMRVVDVFGDNGVVGLLLAERKGAVCEIDTLLMSCRVINRGAETCMLHWLAERAKAEGATAVEGWIFPTDRNVPVREVYASHGFAPVETTEAGTRWRLELGGQRVPAPHWVKILDETKG
jgi:FkbH-like protein